MSWDERRSRRPRRGHCPVCGEQTESKILVLATPATGNHHLASRGVTLCDEHARALFDRLAAIIDETRGSRP